MNNLERLRSENPLVICYTNDVVKNFTANGLLSLGASPAMSEAPEEAEDFTRMASALLINIGTLTRENEEDIIKNYWCTLLISNFTYFDNIFLIFTCECTDIN